MIYVSLVAIGNVLDKFKKRNQLVRYLEFRATSLLLPCLGVFYVGTLTSLAPI